MYYFCLRKGLATSLFRVVTFKTANKDETSVTDAVVGCRNRHCFM